MADEHLIVRGRDDFATALALVLADPASGEALAGRARQLARGLYDWEAVGKLACDAIEAVARA